jgi:hypothetical protein
MEHFLDIGCLCFLGMSTDIVMMMKDEKADM